MCQSRTAAAWIPDPVLGAARNPRTGFFQLMDTHSWGDRERESLFWSRQRERQRRVDPYIRELKRQKYGMIVCRKRGGGGPRQSPTSSPSSCCAEGSLKAAAAAAPCVCPLMGNWVD